MRMEQHVRELKGCLDRLEKLLYSNRQRTYSTQDVEDMKSQLYNIKAYLAEIEEFMRKQ